MRTLHHPEGSAFKVSDTGHRFGSARDAIDAVSAFEASTLDDWEYELQAVSEHPAYIVRLNCITRDMLVRGYLAPAQ